MRSHSEAVVSNTSSSPLLSLPAELRNTIYEYVLSKPDGTYVINDVFTRRVTALRLGIEQWSPPVLLAVNQQIRREAAAIHFSLNTFTYRGTGELRWWLAVIGANIALLRRIRYDEIVPCHPKNAQMYLNAEQRILRSTGVNLSNDVLYISMSCQPDLQQWLSLTEIEARVAAGEWRVPVRSSPHKRARRIKY